MPADMLTTQQKFRKQLQSEVSLSRYTSARVGGPAEMLLVVNTLDELAEIVTELWEMDLPFIILGSGSNVLVSDAGVRGVVLINRSRRVNFNKLDTPPTVWAESGANFSLLSRQAAAHGLSGLEWATGIPGTVGGAVAGNAGAFGDDIASNLVVADILHHKKLVEVDNKSVVQREIWPAECFGYAYRSSVLKLQPGMAVVMAATLRLGLSTPEAVKTKVDAFSVIRHRTQPPGASMGSIFKNPPGDYAGRLIEAAGLKGSQVGGAQISPVHANFIINRGTACANDIYQLIDRARGRVEEQFGVRLELEIQLIGDWPGDH